MHATHAMLGRWDLMVHGVAFMQYDQQNGPRGSNQLGSVNWGMLMAGRSLGGGRLQFRGMMSLEPFTVGAHGYPLLLQSGEVYRGMALVDRQHPHDLFMELAAQYEHPVSNDVAVSLYAAPVGEPAVGPVAFPHRPSAANDPLAPISHHWQDATHIAFGVFTAGLFTHDWKGEGSGFNGREADENRTNFDYRGRSLDSYAGRATWNPSAAWSVGGSFAYLKSPEGLHPDESLHRVTASALYARPIGSDGVFAATAVYGLNQLSGPRKSEPSYGVEGNLDFLARHSVFGRLEYVRKDAADLALPASVGSDPVNVGELTLGYAYDFHRAGPLRVAIGIEGSLNFVPQSLESLYGSSMPTGLVVFFRLRPTHMSGMHHHMMDGMPMETPAAGGRR